MDTPQPQSQDLKPEMTLEESVKEVMQTLPPVVREYLKDGRYTSVVKELMTKYDLRIDQAGTLEREVILLLLGTQTPDALIKALTEEAKLDQRTVRGIVEDVNVKIFVPLREAEERANQDVGSASTPRAGELAPVAISAQKEKTVMPEAPLATTKPVTPPWPSSELRPSGSNLAPLPRSAPSLAPPQKTPAPTVSPAQMPPPAPPPAPAPAPKPPVPPIPLTPKPLTTPPAPIKSYATDPYREPVDTPPVT